MITTNHAMKLRAVMEQQATSLTDEAALEVPELFPKWTPKAYEMGERVRYQGILYKCLQDHSENETWNPADAPSLWARVLIPDPEVIPDWVQPESTNPYMTGDKVRYEGHVWVSTVDNNVWAPGVYGWEMIE